MITNCFYNYIYERRSALLCTGHVCLLGTRHARQMGSFPRRSIVERDSKSGIHYAETRSVSGDTSLDETGTHYVTKPSSNLHGRKENRLDRTGKQML
jgi:hypothetical protein